MIYVAIAMAGYLAGLATVYLSTHPEFRGALFSKVHSTAEELIEEIKLKSERARQKS